MTKSQKEKLNISKITYLNKKNGKNNNIER